MYLNLSLSAFKIETHYDGHRIKTLIILFLGQLVLSSDIRAIGESEGY
jgi:hypothetical protein